MMVKQKRLGFFGKVLSLIVCLVLSIALAQDDQGGLTVTPAGEAMTSGAWQQQYSIGFSFSDDTLRATQHNTSFDLALEADVSYAFSQKMMATLEADWEYSTSHDKLNNTAFTSTNYHRTQFDYYIQPFRSLGFYAELEEDGDRHFNVSNVVDGIGLILGTQGDCTNGFEANFCLRFKLGYDRMDQSHVQAISSLALGFEFFQTFGSDIQIDLDTKYTNDFNGIIQAKADLEVDVPLKSFLTLSFDYLLQRLETTRSWERRSQTSIKVTF